MSSDNNNERSIARAIVNGEFTPKKAPPRRKRKLERSQRSEDLDFVLRQFQQSKHGVRLSASNIAAIAGFHPYSCLPKLIMDLIYQGSIGQKLLERDARLLNIQLTSEEQALLELANKAGVKEAYNKSVDVSKGKVEVNSIQEANNIKQNIVQKAKKAGKLNQSELKQLSEGIRQNVNTGYGKVNEDDALNMYEKACGWEVNERNEVFRIWNFKRHTINNIATVEPLGDAEVIPPRPLDISSDNYKKEKNEVIVIDSDDDSVKGENLFFQKTSNESEGIKPFFSITGIADGIRDELYHNPDSISATDDNWLLRKVVVECKHRMRSATIPPPFYDQLQSIVYCFMYNTSESDLIQIVRTKKSNKDHKEKEKIKADIQHKDDSLSVESTGENLNSNSSSANISITTSRVSLNDQIMKHRENWFNVILPRLRQFVDVVYDFRCDDDKRYCLLTAVASSDNENDDTMWSKVLDELPYLKDCDIAYYRS